VDGSKDNSFLAVVMSKNKLETYVALLRAINVGGNNKVSMTDLKRCLEKLGYQSVKTYINSGNVIFQTAGSSPRKLEVQLEKAFAATFAFPTVIIVRTLKEVDNLINDIPEKWDTTPDLRCNVMFLRHTIDKPEVMNDVIPKPGIEEVHYCPGAILWSISSVNVTRSNVAKIIGKPVYKEITIRTVNTARKINQLMKETSMERRL
jgi:uncharacterized protein (DUF1697 family)